MDNEKKGIESNENKDLVTNVLEKVGVIEKEVKVEKENNKTLNQRIEDLVINMERVNNTVRKEFSFKRIFFRGLLQGLGFVIGSTILAGILYSISTKFIDKHFIEENTLRYHLKQDGLLK